MIASDPLPEVTAGNVTEPVIVLFAGNAAVVAVAVGVTLDVAVGEGATDGDAVGEGLTGSADCDVP